MPHPQTTSLHDRRGLVFDPRWPAVVLQLATLSGRLCELLSIASTVVTATIDVAEEDLEVEVVVFASRFCFWLSLAPG